MINRRHFLALALAFGATLAASIDARAQSVAALARKSILLIDHGAGNQAPAQVHPGDLETIGLETLVTETPFTEGQMVFRGVSLARLIDTYLPGTKTIKATAVNDYAVEIDVAYAIEHGAFIAFEANGERMSVRSKGPYWIVFPWSEHPEYRVQAVNMIAIWQLVRIAPI